MQHPYSTDAEKATDNVRKRVARHAKDGHAIVCMSRANMIRHFQDIWPRDHVCQSCKTTVMTWKDRQESDIKRGRRDAVDYNILPNIDKIDPVKGYVAGNMRIICTDCNGATSDATDANRLAIRLMGIYTKADALGIGDDVRAALAKLMEKQ